MRDGRQIDEVEHSGGSDSELRQGQKKKIKKNRQDTTCFWGCHLMPIEKSKKNFDVSKRSCKEKGGPCIDGGVSSF